MTSPKHSNIVLIGFMASGKSRIGAMLAKNLGFRLLDIDSIIEKEQERSISELIKEKGEAHFREVEAEVIKSLEHCKNTVIVTGGGAPLFFDNAVNLKKLGLIFFLDARLPLIKERLKRNTRRPLGKIVTTEEQERLEELFLFRRPVYQNLGLTIDVNHEDRNKTCEEIADKFLSINRIEILKKTSIKEPMGRYPIYHQENILIHIKDIIAAAGLEDYYPVIVTNESLLTILKTAIDNLPKYLEKEVFVVAIKDGEEHKNFQSIHHIHAEMFKKKLTRKTLIMALGGGNIGDVAGFAAAIYLRGIPFIQIPTTLLAMVDSSIGGKTGIDTSFGKNLVGAFYNPKAVIIDPRFLLTLPKEDVSSGMAEVIKHAIIGDKELFYHLKNGLENFATIIEEALKVKASIVYDDPKENSVRSHLNLGHTFAHAIEKVSNYKIKHGIAVGMGLVLATKLARSLNLLEEDFLDDLVLVLKKFDLPISLPKDLDTSLLIAAMSYDKKRDNQGLKLILPKKIGEVFGMYIEEKYIREVLEAE